MNKSQDVTGKMGTSIQNTDVKNVIRDTADGSFDVDWDTIEKNSQKYWRHNQHHKHLHSTSNKNINKNGIQTNSNKKHKKLKIILICIVCFILAIIISSMTLYYWGKKQLLNYNNINITPPDFVNYEDNGKTIYYNGHTYKLNENISSILFMGIDNQQLKDNADPGTAGQADALYLFTYNLTNGKIKVLSLNRDTIADINRYDIHGNFHDSSTSQLCLAYAYGDGKVLSAENQVSSVEKLIYNIPINGYYAIDLSAIKILNDDIGGVTLTPQYSFGSFTKGHRITILGDKAEEFVRHRDITLLDDNLRRIECQKLYINSFTNQIIPAVKNDWQIPFKLYKHSSENTITNLKAPILVYLASSLSTNFSSLEITSMKGKYVWAKDNKFPEFEIEQKIILETVLDIFYMQTN